MKLNRLIRVSTTIVLLGAALLNQVHGRADEQRGTTTGSTAAESTATQNTSQLAEQRRMVQESSQRIAALVRLRPATITPKDGEVLVQQQIDREIAAIRQARAQAIEALVLAENPKVQLIECNPSPA